MRPELRAFEGRAAPPEPRAFERRAPEAIALARVAAASALLAPAALGAHLAGVAACAWLELDTARSCLAALGVAERPRALVRLDGGRSNAVYRVELATRALVLKRALPAGTLLALAARWVGPQPFARDVSGPARIAREARALATLAAAGVRVPRLVAANARAGLLLAEHVAGEPLPATLARPGADDRIAAYARALRAAHHAGVVLTDGHPGNALVSPTGDVTLIDLEFAEHAADLGGAAFAARCAFDVAYAAAYFTPRERAVFLAASSAPTSGAIGPRAAASRPQPRIDEFSLLFALERQRQRRAA
jgi:hypothetical protein